MMISLCSVLTTKVNRKLTYQKKAMLHRNNPTQGNNSTQIILIAKGLQTNIVFHKHRCLCWETFPQDASINGLCVQLTVCNTVDIHKHFFPVKSEAHSVEVHLRSHYKQNAFTKNLSFLFKNMTFKGEHLKELSSF